MASSVSSLGGLLCTLASMLPSIELSPGGAIPALRSLFTLGRLH